MTYVCVKYDIVKYLKMDYFKAYPRDARSLTNGRVSRVLDKVILFRNCCVS